MKENYIKIVAILLLTLLNSCATYKAQYKIEGFETKSSNKDISHTFYLIGDAGNSPLGSKSVALEAFEKILFRASKNSTALFLGDNIYPSGMPKKDQSERAFAEHQLNVQTGVVKNFAGRTIFIPGNHDWYSNGPKGLKRQEKYVEGILGKNTFLPENGCPIEKVDINDDIVLIIIDSEWYLSNWDHFPTINDDCEFNTRSKFFDEFESLVKKARGKTTIIAVHHPMFSNGPHGGQYPIKQHMTPLPVLGTLKNVIRKTSGVSPADLQHKRYDEFKDRMITLSQENDKVIFVSGHEHSLQYLIEDNLPQIISGSGSKLNPTRNVGGGLFSYATPGYARLDVFKDGSSYVKFYSVEEESAVFETDVLKEKVFSIPDYPSDFPGEKSASVYSQEETYKYNFSNWLWGNRYRQVFSTIVKVPTVNLDTLFGGLTPIRKGGGHQSNSLRFEDKQGKEYIMRALRKNGVQYLQSMIKDQFIKEDFKGTKTEAFTMDFFTGSHPYIPFTTGVLSDAVSIYHTNPELFYVPKQNAIGKFNDEYGDELYMIEERAADGHGDKASFGFSDELISTHDLLKKLRKNENHKVDEATYIRARLFDMLIGDWDRHHDQWRWAVFKDGEKTLYKPVPRDRDQAFSLMDDGVVTGYLTLIIPPIRILHSYEEELRSVKWFNVEPYPLDMALIRKSGRSIWNEQVKYITTHLTDSVIDQAFSNLPDEVKGETIQEIKIKLKGRRSNLQKIADEYFEIFNKFAIVKGTDKDDWFDIVRLPNGQTKVTGYRIKKGNKGAIFHQRIYSREDTKEIWLYALNGKDHIETFGKGSNLIKLRLIGGLNNDTYNILNGGKTHIYDFKSKSNTYLTKLGKRKIIDDYETNNYDYKKPKYNSRANIPIIGSNPDDGFKVGIINLFSGNGFVRNPFTYNHKIAATYYSATKGFDLNYSGEFAQAVGDWNFALEGIYTSPNYSINFFGFGNSTPNQNADDEDNFNKNFNRVKLGTLGISTSLVWRGEHYGKFRIGVNYETIELDVTEGRFIESFFSNNPMQETTNNFVGAEAIYSFQNNDNPAFPTLGFQTELEVGVKSNTDDSSAFGYIIPSLGFNYKLVSSGRLVFATKSKAHFNIGDDFEFYHAASIGRDDGLRGYRYQRFTGKTSFYQNSDLRLSFKKHKTSILPVELGIYGGFDLGRVWVDDDLVSDPDFNLDQWNTSVGGGFFINAMDMISGNIAVFSSDDGILFSFGIGFDF